MTEEGNIPGADWKVVIILFIARIIWVLTRYE